jgi:hypothetical protein
LPPPQIEKAIMEATSTTVSQLTREAKVASSQVIDLPGTISALVKHAAANEADPYITLGVLVEGIAHTVAQAIPGPKQVETAKGVTHLLLDRFAAQGLIR